MSDSTLDTYNASAKELAEYFRGIGSRVTDIEKALALAARTNGTANVLELGCGDGRDAAEIIKRSASYTGIDYSEGLISLARELVPGADFRVVSMTDFEYPEDSYDVVFAFASMLHISKQELARLMPRIAQSLRPGGILFVSLKQADKYKEEWKEDAYGKRLFYFYNPQLLTEIASEQFETVYQDEQTIGHTPWFEIALRKK